MKKKVSKIPKFVLVSADYWEALYVDGQSIDQGHHVDLIANLAEYGILIEEIQAYNDPALEGGQFPDKLSEVTPD